MKSGRMLTVAVAGLGSVGGRVAKALDQGGIAGLELVAVSAAHLERPEERLADLSDKVVAEPAEQLVNLADVVVECVPPSAFASIAIPVAKRHQGILVATSVGSLFTHEEIFELAKESGARLIAPSGAVAGIDGLRAAALVGLERVQLVSRKPPASFGGSLTIAGRPVKPDEILEPTMLFDGTAREAVHLYPKNLNVAATVSLAGVGADKTEVEIWADPSVSENRHELHVWSRAGYMTATSTNLPDPANPRSSMITGYSVLAALRRLADTLSVGS